MLGTIQISGSHLSDAQVGDICESVASHRVPLLTLRKCRTKDRQFQAIAKAVGRSKALLQLNLNLGLVSSRGRILDLADALLVNRSLSTLLLYGSRLGDKGAIVLCHALVRHPQIVTLDLGNCGLTDLSIPYVIQLLPSNGAKPGLHELTLSANKSVTPTGWTHFSVAMAAGCHLQALYVDYNPLGDQSFSCLLVAAAATKSLALLDVEACHITNSGAELLLHTFETHKTSLRKVVLRGNTISRRLLKDVQESLREQLRRSPPEDSTSGSYTDSSSNSDIEDQLEPQVRKFGTTKRDPKPDAVNSSTTALLDFSMEDTPGETARASSPLGNNTEHKTERPYNPEQGLVVRIEEPSENHEDHGTKGETTPKNESDEGSELRTVEGYIGGQQRVYSNLYLQSQQQEGEGLPSYSDAMKHKADQATYSHAMRASLNGYG